MIARLVLLTAALALGACRSTNPSACRATGTVVSSAPPAPRDLPPGWGRIRPLLEAGRARVDANDVAGLKALAPEIQAEGLSLLKSNMPNDLARPDVPRYLEGRSLFGKALVEFASAAEAGRDAELFGLFTRLSEAWYAWMAALRGLPPERAL